MHGAALTGDLTHEARAEQAVRTDPVQVLCDRDVIHDVVMRYAKGVDSRDMEMVRSCFSPDCDATRWGPGPGDREAMIEYISGVGHFHTTMHMMGNQFVEVDGDRAAVDSYAMLTHHRELGDGRVHKLDVNGSRYVEHLERRDGAWVVVQRGGEPSWAPNGVRGLDSADPAVRWLLDRAEIHDLLVQYALGVDMRDDERIRRCFAPGFHAAYGDREFVDLDELCAFISGVEHFHSTTHFLGTQLVEVAAALGTDEAWCTTYSLITHRPREDDPEAEWVAAGRYVDRLARVDGEWRIADRGARAHAGRPARLAAPTAGDDARVVALVDRAVVHDVIVRSAIDSDDASGGTTHHFLNNQLVEIDGDRAHAETYLFAVEREAPGAPPSPWSDGARRWLDELVRGDGGWELAGRREVTNRVPDELVLHPE